MPLNDDSNESSKPADWTPKPPSLIFPESPRMVPPPTPFQLVEAPPPRRVRGFFEELLATDPAPLLEDAQQHPEAYDQDALEILQQLYSRRRGFQDLSEAEKLKLNEATMEFYSSTPRSTVPVNARHSSHEPMRAPAAPRRAQPIDGPVLDSFWWT